MDSSDVRADHSEVVHRNPYFQVRRTRRASSEWFSVDAADSAVMVAEGPDSHLVMVRGSRVSGGVADSWELPGGFVDRGETPRRAAERELLEETGYEASDVAPIAVMAQIPAISAARTHVFAGTAQLTSSARLERGEDWAVELVPVTAVKDLVLSGAVDDALTLAILGQWVLRRS